MLSRRRWSLGGAVVLAVAAVSLGLYAGSAAATPPPPTTCTSTTCNWTGQGVPLDQECDSQNDPYGYNKPYLLWIFTTGGRTISGGATLTLGGTGSGVYTGTPHGKEFHFVTPYFAPSYPSLTGHVTYGGPLGNWQLVISHGCAGGPPDTTPPTCMLTSTITGPPKQIQITVQDIGSGLESIVVTKSTNASTVVPAFTMGTTSPVVVTSTKLNQTLGSVVALTVNDVSGNSTSCDPVVPASRSLYHGFRGYLLRMLGRALPAIGRLG